MIKAHKIRLNPTEEQAAYFWKAAGVSRFAFNWGLARWNELYAAGEKGITAYGLRKEFNAIKRTEFPWVMEVTAWACDGAFADLGKAVKNFFDKYKAGTLPKLDKPRKDGKPGGWPQFKSRGKTTPAFYLHNEAFRFDGHMVRIERLGWVNMTQPLRFDGKVMSGRVSHYAGHWWLSVALDIPHEPQAHEGPAIGVDLGLKSLAVTSDGEVFDNPKALKKAERKIAKLNRQFSRKQSGSANSKKAAAKLAKAHYKVRSIRLDAAHKMTTAITSDYGFIGLEDLNVKGMAKNHSLAGAVKDAAFGEIRRQIGYKAEWNGVAVQTVDRFYPSSKTCANCSYINQDLTQADRKWTCPACGAELDRDFNAAQNIRDEALRLAALNNSARPVVPTSDVMPVEDSSVEGR